MRISDWSSDVCSSDLASTGIPPSSILTTSPPSPRRSRRRPGQSSSRASLIPAARSEEHTSELQSLMRISYAVFCLKKKKIEKGKSKIQLYSTCLIQIIKITKYKEVNDKHKIHH